MRVINLAVDVDNLNSHSKLKRLIRQKKKKPFALKKKIKSFHE